MSAGQGDGHSIERLEIYQSRGVPCTYYKIPVCRSFWLMLRYLAQDAVVHTTC